MPVTLPPGSNTKPLGQVLAGIPPVMYSTTPKTKAFGSAGTTQMTSAEYEQYLRDFMLKQNQLKITDPGLEIDPLPFSDWANRNTGTTPQGTSTSPIPSNWAQVVQDTIAKQGGQSGLVSSNGGQTTPQITIPKVTMPSVTGTPISPVSNPFGGVLMPGSSNVGKTNPTQDYWDTFSRINAVNTPPIVGW